MVENDRLAGDDVGGHRPERDRQAQKSSTSSTASVSRRKMLSIETPAISPFGRCSPWRSTQLPVDETAVVLGLAPHRHLGAGRRVVEDVAPVRRRDQALHPRDRRSGRVRAADDRPHARARDAVDRHAQVLEDLEHADVRRAARAAAGECERDARALAGGGVGRLRAREARREARRDDRREEDGLRRGLRRGGRGRHRELSFAALHAGAPPAGPRACNSRSSRPIASATPTFAHAARS